jgi:hypothetical protein
MLRFLTVFVALVMGCSGPAQKQRRRPRDPNVRTLDRLLAKGHRQSAAEPEGLKACLRRAALQHPCAARSEDRTLTVRVFLDPRYASRFAGWERRLARTFTCVNTLYGPTGISWDVEAVEPWAPGAQRHDLFGLLDRLQREHPYDGKSLTLGITVWDERRIYAAAGGEIGLSQHAACVVPSWPRVENDCLILAHELGHLVKARHVPGKQWIMGWAARPFHLPASDPIARVTALYRFHPRNVAAIAMHRGAAFTPHGLALPQGCRERLRAIDRCWKLR